MDPMVFWLHSLLLMDDTAVVSTSRQACVQTFTLLLDYCNEYGVEVCNRFRPTV